jgi:hypothetical protein
MYSSTLSSTSALDGVGGKRHAPTALPPGDIRYPLYSRLGGTQGRSGRVQKISPLPGFDPRTVQPVASRYTNLAIPARCCVQYYEHTKSVQRQQSSETQRSKEFVLSVTVLFPKVPPVKQAYVQCLVTIYRCTV